MSVRKVYRLGEWEYWYDSSTRCWWAAVMDAAGNQVGDAMDAYSKREILLIVENPAMLALVKRQQPNGEI